MEENLEPSDVEQELTPSPPSPPAVDMAPQLTEDEQNMALLTHLSAIILGLFGPLLFWLIKKDESGYLDAVGKTALNFNISYSIYMFVAGMLMFVLIGFLLFPIVWITWLVLVIVAAIKARDGENYKPFLTIELLK